MIVEPVADSEVVHMPAPKARSAGPRHVFGDPLDVAAAKSPSGLNQTERICTQCGAVKVTVHLPGGGARREWRPKADSESQHTTEIACTGPIGVAR